MFYMEIFDNRNRERPIYLNLGKIVEMVKKGRLDATKLIDIKALYEANVFKKCIYGVKVLSRVKFRLKLKYFT